MAMIEGASSSSRSTLLVVSLLLFLLHGALPSLGFILRVPLAPPAQPSSMPLIHPLSPDFIHLASLLCFALEDPPPFPLHFTNACYHIFGRESHTIIISPPPPFGFQIFILFFSTHSNSSNVYHKFSLEICRWE